MKATRLLLIFFSILALAGYVYFRQSPVPPATSLDLTASQSAHITTTKPPIHLTPPAGSTGLSAAVASALSGSHGTYAVVIKNLKTGESYTQNDQQEFESASLYKLWVMGTAIDQIENGNLSQDDILSRDVSYLNNEFNIDPDEAELADGTVTMSVSDAINQMIIESNNYDAFLLVDRIGLPTIAAWLSQNSFSKSSIGVGDSSPTTTASDTAIFLEKLYDGKLANKVDTDLMIATLKNQQLNWKLPEYIPQSVAIAHKTGELDSFSHDAGIVYGPSGDYIIVVLSDSADPDLANERIALISKNVYHYFNS